MSVSVCEHFSGTTHLNLLRSSLNFSCMLPVAVARSSSGALALYYVLSALWLTSCFHMMDPMAAYQYYSSVVHELTPLLHGIGRAPRLDEPFRPGSGSAMYRCETYIRSSECRSPFRDSRKFMPNNLHVTSSTKPEVYNAIQRRQRADRAMRRKFGEGWTYGS